MNFCRFLVKTVQKHFIEKNKFVFNDKAYDALKDCLSFMK